MKIIAALAVVAAFVACGVLAFGIYAWRWGDEDGTQGGAKDEAARASWIGSAYEYYLEAIYEQADYRLVESRRVGKGLWFLRFENVNTPTLPQDCFVVDLSRFTFTLGETFWKTTGAAPVVCAGAAGGPAAPEVPPPESS
jgi:hypothetical protein